MYFKISPINQIIFSFLLFSVFLTGCSNAKLDYTIDVVLNPNNISPLTAMLNIESDIPCKATVKVLGDIPVEQSYKDSNTNLNVPVLGLYPNKLNQVEITLDLMHKIQEKVPQLVGLKHSAPQIDPIRQFRDMGLCCMMGNSNLMLQSLLMGASGCIDGPPGVMPINVQKLVGF